MTIDDKEKFLESPLVDDRCPNGHRMGIVHEIPPQYADGDGVFCDKCKGDVNVSEGYLHCETCQYDVCRDCAENEVFTTGQ